MVSLPRLMPCPLAALAFAVGGAASVVLGVTPATADTVSVTNNSDAGPGSFRAAVEQANADSSITDIQFQANLGTIEITDPITYTGGQSLSIDGRGTAIEPDVRASFELFVSSGGGDLM